MSKRRLTFLSLLPSQPDNFQSIISNSNKCSLHWRKTLFRNTGVFWQDRANGELQQVQSHPRMCSRLCTKRSRWKRAIRKRSSYPSSAFFLSLSPPIFRCPSFDWWHNHLFHRSEPRGTQRFDRENGSSTSHLAPLCLSSNPASSFILIVSTYLLFDFDSMWEGRKCVVLVPRDVTPLQPLTSKPVMNATTMASPPTYLQVGEYLWAIAMITVPTIVFVGTVGICVYLCLVVPYQRYDSGGNLSPTWVPKSSIAQRFGPAGTSVSGSVRADLWSIDRGHHPKAEAFSFMCNFVDNFVGYVTHFMMINI